MAVKAKTTISVGSAAGFTRRSVISVDGELMWVARVQPGYMQIKRLRWWHRAWMWVRRRPRWWKP